MLPFSHSIKAQEWKVESESAEATVTWKNGTCDIFSPMGLTLWYDHRMEGNTVIEYEAMIVADKKLQDVVPSGRNDKPQPRISDLNCFWMANSCGGYGGRFLDNYALCLYYMGYGGNYNTTTRFRRYNGDARGVSDAKYRPAILKEYTDEAHLLKANHWYKIRLEQIDGHIRYYSDGDLLVDYVDPEPLTSGYFGFRTTFAHARLRNFKYSCSNPDTQPIVIRNIHSGRKASTPITFGVPFAKSETDAADFQIKTTDGRTLAADSWRLASWPDGSTKWQAFTTIVPGGCDSILLYKGKETVDIPATANSDIPPFQVTLNHKVTPITAHTIERQGRIETVHKYTGDNFIIRAYTYKGSDKIKLVHTLIVDSMLNRNGLNELGLHFKVAMHGKAYERYVNLDSHKMSVQPLVARREINMQKMDERTRLMLDNIAKWDGFRLSQLSPNGYSIRKRATSHTPWIGTIEGTRSKGWMAVGDNTSQTAFWLKDFWESYPSTLQVDNARSDTATVSIYLYSPEAEPYSFEHYDTIAHSLEAAYEDVQPGMSTAWGIGRTSTIYIYYNGDASIADDLAFSEPAFLPTPEYMHRKRAFGIWSLPTRESERDIVVENALDSIMHFYNKEIERNGWYGYFNYGDVMHTYDPWRGQWRYDVGGYAWDNTELGTPAMLWYQFLRTASPEVWRMATAMTRHCSEVDSYHIGPHAGLGSRHNVIHWGCGAKESRISEAWWNRFMYYLTADDRLGDIMHEVADADTLLYNLDPMRLAQPRSLFPCTAPARLRIGPDWLGYVSNWMTEWERFGKPNEQSEVSLQLCHGEKTSNEVQRETERYKNKILTGMNSIASLRHGIFSGPKALGYYPDSGRITNECDSTVMNTNHLITIMGGFELINELELSIDHKPFFATWLDHAARYKTMAKKITKSKFLIPRLSAYAGWRLGDEQLKATAWDDLLNHLPLDKRNKILSTNDCATWALDAIFLKEVINK